MIVMTAGIVAMPVELVAIRIVLVGAAAEAEADEVRIETKDAGRVLEGEVVGLVAATWFASNLSSFATGSLRRRSTSKTCSVA